MSTTTTTTATTTLSGSTREDPAPYIPRGPAETTLNFFVDPEDGSAPFNYVEQPPPGEPQNNYRKEAHQVTVNDIRGHEDEYSLDKHAFLALKSVPTSVLDTQAFDDDDDAFMKNSYYPEVERIILDNVPGSNRVLIFDHTIRRSRPGAKRGPVNQTHVDQTDHAAMLRVRHHVEDPEEAERLLQGRYRIINVWRPLNGAVESGPLAFASADSVGKDDLVPVQHRYPNRTGQTVGVRHNPQQRWNYWSGMDNNERLLLKCSDSRTDVGRAVPHSAFSDPRSPPNAKGRDSIEVRALVFG
ncbi:hypothetical protein FQN54_001733 [Arachnomyces sp. PD_36]|nr:hypothetical protein FQN54_001733 [Arachnomyces sp. PD_36]